MLSGLDDVAWDQLRHAYGEASDVPELLRALAEGDDDALYELHGNIWHQGTVYEATAFAVPFLVELLDHAPDRVGILGLLAVIADGSPYASESTRDSDAGRIERELSWVRAARAAVAAGAPTLLRLLLGDPDEEVRAAAAQTLGQALDPDDPSVGDLLERAETDDSPLVRASVIVAADRLQAATPSPVARWRTDPDPLPRVVAALVPPVGGGALARDVPDAIDAIQRLPEAEGDPVTWVIDRLEPWPDLQVDLLRGWLAHGDAGLRVDVLAATDTPIQTWRAAAAELVPAIAACLADADRDVRYRAAMSLAQAGRATATCVDELWSLLEREPAGYNTPAYYALTALCRRRDPRAASYVASGLRAAEVDWAALRTAIRLLGPWAGECREPLISLISVAPAGNDRIAVIDAVGRLLTPDLAPSVVPTLVAECAGHPHVTTRVLGDLGPAAEVAVPTIESMLGHEAMVVRVNAARALWRVTGDAGRVLPFLREVVRTTSRFDRSYALAALGELGPAAADVPLAPYFDDEDDWVAVRSVAAHFAVTGDPEPALSRLARHIHARPVGFEAVRCLAAIGPAAAPVAPRLREAVSSPRRQTESGSAADWVEVDEEWQDLCAGTLSHIAPTPRSA